MKNKSFFLYTKVFMAFFCFTNICFSQMVVLGPHAVENSAKVIIIGHILEEKYLEKTEIGAMPHPDDHEGSVYTVQVLNVLKGNSNITHLKIFQTRDDESGGELPSVFLFEGKDYLLFLGQRKPPQYFTDKYKLNDSCYYAPMYAGMGIVDINQNAGLEKLRTVEQYLNVSAFPWRVKAFAEWIELLKTKLQSGYQNGQIGGLEFVNNLLGVLSNVNDKMQAGDSVNCAKEIQRLHNIIWGAYIGFDRMRFVVDDLLSSLSRDISYLDLDLPEIPDGNTPFLGHIIYLGKVYAGGAGFTLTINGEDFENGATFYWNWSPRVTTFISSTQLQANITSADIAKADTVTVAVVNPNGSTHGAEFIVLPPSPSSCNVKLVNSTGTKLTGGALQYYEGTWKDAVNNNDGTFFINTTAKTLSLRMTYEYGTQTKSNVTVGYDTVVFQTVNAQIQLQNSNGVLIDTGSVLYYAGAWRNLGTTINGTASKELLPANYSFRMTYAYASKDKQQDIGTNATVVFQTVNAAVQLQNSQGSLIDQGTVQYYSGAWRDFGTTTNGVANKELLPNNYSFRMTYAYASKDKQQDVGTNATVVFQTVNTAVQLQNSLGNLIDQGTVQYYSGAWRELGTTTNGIATKELLPNTYSFRMTYAYASKDKQQDIGTNATVVFQTVNAAVQLKNSQGNLIDQGTVQYYSGAWRTLGTTTNGTATKDLLPNTYSFRMTYEYVSVDKAQDISTNNTVNFSTVLCTIRVKNSQSQPVNGALASYYSGAWRQIGNTVNGEVTKELLPVNLSFRVKYGTQQQDKKQNLSTNNVVEFTVQ
jgi:hypothetical protein